LNRFDKKRDEMIAKPNKPIIFATDLFWSAEGHGIVSSHSMNHSITISTLPAGQSAESEWSGEQLFLSGVTTSLLNTYLELSKKIQLSNTGFECTATAQAELVDGKMKFTFIHVYPKAFVSNEDDIQHALVTLEMARKVCPLYNSINAEIIQHPEAVITKKKNEAA
jgi:organic hydroperoxide reductase OsmC/OhrA